MTGAVVRSGRWWWIGGLAAVAGMAYVPLLAVRPGVITPDTKTYLYLDPTRFLSQVAFMWNPTVGLGTVNHQYIGYLLPMGPFFAVFHLLGVPVWVAQRLWLGTILFGAGLGVLYLSRILGLKGPGPTAAALAYMLSPYFLQYAGRISVILLPWAGLPFMLGLTIVALRRGGWREPALFAFVVALVSGINASSVIYVGVAPILWLFYAVVVLRESTWRHALSTGLRIAILTLGASLWWIAGLEVEAAYGVNVLKFTETVPSTSATSNPADIIRGLGYWYFYGTDHLGPWTNAAVRYTQNIWLIGTSLAVPVVALVVGAFVRWKERAYFLLLLFLGLVLSVGPFPFDDPTRIGGWLKSFMTDTTAGLALRSTDRATPLVLLALVMLLGSALTALWLRLSIVGILTALCVAGLVIANIPSLFNGDTIANNFTQPAALPAYQQAAINHLNATHPGTRVFAIPGNDFASDRWGDTIDTPQPALLNRDFVTREQQIMGSIATADTLYAIDGPMQDGIANMNALAPMSRLMGAGDVMVEYDQRYEHYGVPQSELLALQLLQTPPGLSDPTSFGTPRPNVSTDSTLNEEDLSVPGNVGWPSPIVTYTVANPRPMLRAESDSGAIVMEGDATGRQQSGRPRPAQHGQRDLLRRHAGVEANAAPSAGVARGPARGDRHEPQAGLPLGHADGQRGLHGDAGREPGQDGPERQPDRALPGHRDVVEDLRVVRGRGQRDGEQLRQQCLLHARGPGLQRHRQQLRLGLDHRHLRARSQGPVVAVAVHQPRDDRPHHAGAAAAGRPLALGLGRDPHLRRQGPHPLRPHGGLACHDGADAHLPGAVVPHAAGHHRLDDEQHRAAAVGRRRGLRRSRDPGPASAPGPADADADAVVGRRGVGRRTG